MKSEGRKILLGLAWNTNGSLLEIVGGSMPIQVNFFQGNISSLSCSASINSSLPKA